VASSRARRKAGRCRHRIYFCHRMKGHSAGLMVSGWTALTRAV
jgi:hypothetical protein